jgi:hypothetical protein
MKIINKKDNKALIYYNNNFYVISQANNMFTNHAVETLIFKSEPDGSIIDYIEVGGGRGLTIDDVLDNIEEHLYQ